MQEIVVPDHEADAEWERLRPAIDDALHTLGETDREAVLLRFFEGRAFAEIGAALRLTEEAARKRVDRALDKLQRALTQRGIVSTSVALSIALTRHSAATAPAGLGATVVALALRPTDPGSALISGAMVAVVLLGVGIATWQFGVVRENANSVAAGQQENDVLRARLQRVERDAVELQREADAAERDQARLKGAIDAASLAGVVDQEASRAAFVIDTSGSMRDPRGGGPYPAVVAKLDEILDANPHLRYFQVFDGDGRYVVADSNGKWLKNEMAVRDATKETLLRYNQDTVSNPVPGVTAALRALDAGRDPLSRLHIFVLGDELNAQERSDLLLAQIDELNPADAKGRRRVIISAVGFPTWQILRNTAPMESNASIPPLPVLPPRTFLRFNHLMTELARRHGGTFAPASGLGDGR